MRKEVSNAQRHINELEDVIQSKDRDFASMVECSRRDYRKMADARNSLQQAYDSALADINELKMALSGAEGRVSALESHIARVEGAKKELEFKLTSIHSSLRRLIGFRQENVVTIRSRHNSNSPVRGRSISPQRSRPVSPTKGIIQNFT